MASIRTVGLTKDFGDLRAVNAIDLDLPEGGVAGFVGPNGAGKSTTIAVSVGLGWFILAEAIIGAFWDGLDRWGQAGVSSALAAGGADRAGMFDGATAGISYATAILLVIGYSLIALTITSTVIVRRDVTS